VCRVGRADGGEHDDYHQPGPASRPPASIPEHDGGHAGDHEDGVEQARINPGKPYGHAALEGDRVHSRIRQEEGSRGHAEDHERDQEIHKAVGPAGP
jgi:hypothetical protein